MIEIHANSSTSFAKALADAAVTEDAVKIILNEGIYEIGDAIEIQRDNLTIEGVRGKTILTGSKRIDLTGMKVNDSSIAIDLKKQGVYDYGKFGEGPFKDFWKVHDIPKPHMCDLGPGLEVFYENHPLMNARYPKTGFLHIKQTLGQTPVEFEHRRNSCKEGIFIADDEVVKQWENEKDLLLVGYWHMDWATQRHTIKRVDGITGAIEVNPPYHVYGYLDSEGNEIGGRFYALNVLSQLNHEGEWHINRNDGILSVYPYKDQKYIDVSVCEDLFLIHNKKNICFKNLVLEQCRKSGIMITESSDITVKDCIIRNTGAWGVLGEKCNDVIVDHCLVYNTGGGGIGLDGGDRNTLVASGNIISNNTIHNVARWHRTYLAAIEICGVGGLVSNNIITDVPHFAVVFHGNNHIIEKNDIGSVCYESNDAGAIYCGRDWSCRGNIIRYNYIHNLSGFNDKGCVGIYFDDAMSSVEVYGNIFAWINNTAILIGGGRDFKIYNNMFYGCPVTVFMDNRLETWAKDLYARLCEQLSKVDYTNEVWRSSYPDMEDFFEQQVRQPQNNFISGNTIVGGQGVVLSGEELRQYSKVEENTLIAMEIEQRHPCWEKTE